MGGMPLDLQTPLWEQMQVPLVSVTFSFRWAGSAYSDSFDTAS